MSQVQHSSMRPIQRTLHATEPSGLRSGGGWILDGAALNSRARARSQPQGGGLFGLQGYLRFIGPLTAYVIDHVLVLS